MEAVEPVSGEECKGLLHRRSKAVEGDWVPAPRSQSGPRWGTLLEAGEGCWLGEVTALCLAGWRPRGRGVPSHQASPRAPGLET